MFIPAPSVNAASNGWTFWSVSTSMPTRRPTSTPTSSSCSSSQRESATQRLARPPPPRLPAAIPSGGSSPSRSKAPPTSARQLRAATRSGGRAAGRPRAAPGGPPRRARRGPRGRRRASARSACARSAASSSGQRRQHRVEAADRLVEDPNLLLVQIGEERLLARLDHDVDLDRPGLAEPVEPADALLEDERRVGEVEADEVGRELEVPPLAARLAGEQHHRPLGIAEARHEPVARLDGGRVVVEERLAAGAGDAGLQLAERLDVVAEDEHLLAARGRAGRRGRRAPPRLRRPRRRRLRRSARAVNAPTFTRRFRTSREERL